MTAADRQCVVCQIHLADDPDGQHEAYDALCWHCWHAWIYELPTLDDYLAGLTNVRQIRRAGP